MLLAFWFWIAEGATFVDVPLGEGEALRLRLPPMSFDAPFGITAPDDAVESGDEEDGPENGDDEESDDDPEELDDEP